jgi:hypothetical protein
MYQVVGLFTFYLYLDCAVCCGFPVLLTEIEEMLAKNRVMDSDPWDLCGSLWQGLGFAFV